MKRNMIILLLAVCSVMFFSTNVFAGYVVKKGDTLWDICEAHYGKGGGNEYYMEVAKASDIPEPDFILPGEHVKFVPKHAKHKHVSKKMTVKKSILAKKVHKKVVRTVRKEAKSAVVVSPNIDVAERIKMVREKRKADQEKKQRETAVGVSALPENQLVIEEVVAKKAEQPPPSEEMAAVKIATPIGLAVIPPTVAGNDGVISGTNSLMEFKYATSRDAYVPATTPSISGLSPADYMVRYSAIPGEYEAGPEAILTVPAYAAPIEEVKKKPAEKSEAVSEKLPDFPVENVRLKHGMFLNYRRYARQEYRAHVLNVMYQRCQ